MTAYPQISVVIPLYNGGKYIEAALSSVQNQPVPVADIIVVDDGSTDNGAALAKAHATQPRVVHQENRGPSAARNHGIDLVQTPFVAFIDQDDLWRPDKLIKQCAAFDEDPDLVACFGRIDYFWEDPDCEEARTFKGHPRTSGVAGYISTTMLAKVEIFDRLGRFNENLMFADSIEWCGNMQDSDVKTRLLDDVVLDHRMHDTNLTRRRNDFGSEILHVLRARRQSSTRASNG